MGEVAIRKPLMSGHCAHMGQVSPAGKTAHARCAGGQRANPAKEFQPCPCSCHYPDASTAELFECGECGKVIIEATRWPRYPAAPGEEEDPRYTHMDWTVNDDGAISGGTGRALGEECYTASVSRNTTPAETSNEKDCIRCGAEFTGNSKSAVCPSCLATEEREKDAEIDAVMAELDDVLDEDAEFDALMDDLDFEDD